MLNTNDITKIKIKNVDFTQHTTDEWRLGERVRFFCQKKVCIQNKIIIDRRMWMALGKSGEKMMIELIE